MSIAHFRPAAIWLAGCVLSIFAVVAAMRAGAAAPDLKTPGPVIYLADNLDERERLGWCIDTVGQGLSDRLHAHSCKPRGGDVQFTYIPSARQIMSATFPGKCATLSSAARDGVSLGLVDCNAAAPGQQFDYDQETEGFHPAGDKSLCIAVGESSRSAGPFMARNLMLATCASTDAKRRQWRIKGA